MSYYHSEASRQLLAKIAIAVCPSQPDPIALAPEIVHHAELSMRAFPAPARTALLAGLKTYDEAARLYPPAKGKAARDLPADIGRRYFQTWWKSKLALQREFARGIKGILCLAYYETAAAKEHIGYTPEAWIEKVKAHRLEVYSEAIEKQQAAILTDDPLPPLDPEVR